MRAAKARRGEGRMPPKFGTSGLRGLVNELTPELIEAYVRAFLCACPSGSGLFVARDLRDSSATISEAVIAAARACGAAVTDCGEAPTPALAFAAMTAGASAIMITGSHIPADRNGLKFYTPEGEITKVDEAAILAAVTRRTAASARPEGGLASTSPGRSFLARYRDSFGPAALLSQRIGVWSHSAVGSDLLLDTLRALGAEVIEFGRSAKFIPVDTEAVDEATRSFLRGEAARLGLSAIVSTDGDGDRPLVTDETGEVIPGDILGQITARYLSADTVVTPISSNSGAELLGLRVVRTKIGSPFVIAGMKAALAVDGNSAVVGYEANGGFLLGFTAKGSSGPLPPLMTRDSYLPIIAPLALAGSAGMAALAAAQPSRFTAADRLQEVPTEAALALIARLRDDATARDSFLATFGGRAIAQDLTDGLRITLDNARIIHLRPSGNAPELRFYAEAESPTAAREMLETGLDQLRMR